MNCNDMEKNHKNLMELNKKNNNNKIIKAFTNIQFFFMQLNVYSNLCVLVLNVVVVCI